MTVMRTRQLSPWNWFRKEESPHGRFMAAPMPTPVGRSDPFTRLQNEMEQIFDSFLSGDGWTHPRNLTGEWPAGPIGATALLRPQLDIAETDKAYTITVEVPGVRREDVEVSMQDDTLVISGEKRQEAREGEGHFHRVERAFGRFRRTLALPDDADAENISAEFSDGLLTITVPRREGLQTSRGRSIPIGEGKSEA